MIPALRANILFYASVILTKLLLQGLVCCVHKVRHGTNMWKQNFVLISKGMSAIDGTQVVVSTCTGHSEITTLL